MRLIKISRFGLGRAYSATRHSLGVASYGKQPNLLHAACGAGAFCGVSLNSRDSAPGSREDGRALSGARADVRYARAVNRRLSGRRLSSPPTSVVPQAARTRPGETAFQSADLP